MHECRIRDSFTDSGIEYVLVYLINLHTDGLPDRLAGPPSWPTRWGSKPLAGPPKICRTACRTGGGKLARMNTSLTKDIHLFTHQTANLATSQQHFCQPFALLKLHANLARYSNSHRSRLHGSRPSSPTSARTPLEPTKLPSKSTLQRVRGLYGAALIAS